MKSLESIVERCTELAFDLNFTHAKEWKAEEEGRVLVGYMPVYIPREIIHAVNGLAVGIMGAGDRKQIIKGDAYYQSYICHIPRGIIEMALDDNLNDFDGFIFPAICDVIRNLSGMFKVIQKGTFVKYLDLPQNFQSHIGGEFYHKEMEHILEYIEKINGARVTTEKLNHSIELFNHNRRLLEMIYDLRQKYPWRMTNVDLYHIVRAGQVIPVEEHNEILEAVHDHLQKDIGVKQDRIKVVVSGSFCEQPPVGLIKSIEMAGCYVVDDDFMIGSRWIQGDVDDASGNPLKALAEAYISRSPFSSSVYDVDNPKEGRLADLVKKRKADGVIFAAPSFCDPALLDSPILQKGCDDRKIRYIGIQYSENTGQFKVIKEQVGAFSDSIKLWEDEPVAV
ncbi:MAG: benzoyl-CoA reductase subunit C [Bacteroidetes bacterium]|nr:MAG: benzoyl-CoA reductase subunit C [Bacteroidota bacterium]